VSLLSAAYNDLLAICDEFAAAAFIKLASYLSVMSRLGVDNCTACKRHITVCREIVIRHRGKFTEQIKIKARDTRTAHYNRLKSIKKNK